MYPPYPFLNVLELARFLRPAQFAFGITKKHGAPTAMERYDAVKEFQAAVIAAISKLEDEHTSFGLTNCPPGVGAWIERRGFLKRPI
jgi:hypothetical protein